MTNHISVSPCTRAFLTHPIDEAWKVDLSCVGDLKINENGTVFCSPVNQTVDQEGNRDYAFEVMEENVNRYYQQQDLFSKFGFQLMFEEK